MDAQLARELGEIKGALAGLHDRMERDNTSTSKAIGDLAEQIKIQNGRVSTTETWRRSHEQEHAVEQAHEDGVREVQAAFSKRDKAILGLLVAVVGPVFSAVVGYLMSGGG